MSRPNPILQDMPRLVKENIVQHMDLFSRFSLRRCSKSYKNVIDNCEITFEKVTLYKIDRWSPELETMYLCFASKHKIKNLHVQYHKLGTRCYIQASEKHPRYSNDGARFIEDAICIMELAMNDLKTVLNNPKAAIKKLEVNYDGFLARRSELFGYLESAFSNLTDKVSAEELTFSCNVGQTELLSILPYLKPGTLKYISCEFIADDVVLNQVAMLNQWKEAKTMCFAECNLPMALLIHFECASFHRRYLSLQDVKDIIERGLNLLRTQERFYFRVVASDRDPSVDDYCARFPEHTRESAYTNGKKHIRIPDTNHYLELTINRFLFAVEKMRVPIS